MFSVEWSVVSCAKVAFVGSVTLGISPLCSACEGQRPHCGESPVQWKIHQVSESSHTNIVTSASLIFRVQRLASVLLVSCGIRFVLIRIEVSWGLEIDFISFLSSEEDTLSVDLVEKLWNSKERAKRVNKSLSNKREKSWKSNKVDQKVEKNKNQNEQIHDYLRDCGNLLSFSRLSTDIM